MKWINSGWVKKSGEWILKIGLVGLAVFLILKKFNGITYTGIFRYEWKSPGFCISFFLLFWVINFISDAYIWKNVSSMEEDLSLKRALKTNFVCYALAFITPANSGELAGRYLMLSQHSDRRKTVFLTFWSHFPRLIIKIGLGSLALIYLAYHFDYINMPLVMIASVVVIVILNLVYFYFNIFQRWLHKQSWGKFTISNYLMPDRPQAALKRRLLILSLLKYLSYNFQFMLLTVMWGPQGSSWHLFFSVILFFCITALIPTFAAADFLIKGALAMYIFNPALGNESLWLNVSFVVWLFNIMFAAAVGSSIILKTNLIQSLKAKFSRGSRYGS